jgi:hypothetical protein
VRPHAEAPSPLPIKAAAPCRTALLTLNPSFRAATTPPPNPSFASARDPPSAASPSPRRPSGAPQAGEEHPGSSCSCSRAPHRPHALTEVLRRMLSASPSGSPPPSPARLPEYHRSIPRVTRFALVQISLQTVPPSPRSSQLARVVCAPPLTATVAPPTAGRRLLGACARSGPPDRVPMARVGLDPSPRGSPHPQATRTAGS